MNKASPPSVQVHANVWMASLVPISILVMGFVGNAVQVSAQVSSLIMYLTSGLLTVALANEILVPLINLGAGTNGYVDHGQTVSQKNLLERRIAIVGGLTLALALMLYLRHTLRSEGTSRASLIDIITINENTDIIVQPNSKIVTEQVSIDIKSTLAGTRQKQLKDHFPSDSPYPITAVLATALDTFIIGLLTGIHWGAGKARSTLGLSLTVENGMLSLAIIEKLKSRHVPESQRIATILGLAGSSALGTLLGYFFSQKIGIGGTAMAGIMSFATVIIGWLIIEELLPDARRVKENNTWKGPTTFISGMLLAIALEWLK